MDCEYQKYNTPHDAEEQQYLLGDGAEPPKNKTMRFRVAHVIVFALVATAVVIASSVFIQMHPINLVYPSAAVAGPDTVLVTSPSISSQSTFTSTVSVSVSNEYGTNIQRVMLPYPFLDGALLLEPHRDNLISISAHTSNDTCLTSWALEADSKLKLFSYSGILESEDTFVVIPQSTGKYALYLTRKCLNEATGASTTEKVSFPVWVKYVRRELLSLTDTDREEFLDAFHTLWTVNTIQGQKIYGEKYRSLYYFAMIHNDAAGNGICDEFHGGLGFVSNHVYLSSYLEQSLQLINPRVALHYMDYSKYFDSADFLQGHLSNTMDGGRWTEIMTEKWFGSNDPLTGRILDGRWANSPVPLVNAEFFRNQGVDENVLFFPAEADRWLPLQSPHMHSSNGLLRARWSLHPENYTIRFNNVDRLGDVQSLSTRSYDKYRGVRCDQYVSFVQSYAVNQTFEVLLDNMEGGVHGPIHFTFGGAGGDKYFENDQTWRDRFGLSDSDVAFISQLSHTYMKLQAPRWWANQNGGMISWNCTFPFDIASSVDEFPQRDANALNWPGEPGNSYCDANSYYYQSDATLDEFLELFFAPLAVSSFSISSKLLALNREDKREAVRLLNTRYQFDGDMATSSAAIDPLFWVQHGAVERLFQRVLFEGVVKDRAFNTLNTCSGHSADGYKAWLAGFEFEDKSVLPETLTNAQLTVILDPATELYRDYINFVYDTESFGFCTELEDLFLLAKAAAA